MGVRERRNEASPEMAYQSHFSRAEKHFLELIRTYTIRDYSLYPHTMSGRARWAGPALITHTEERSAHGETVKRRWYTDVCVSSAPRYKRRRRKPP